MKRLLSLFLAFALVFGTAVTIAAAGTSTRKGPVITEVTKTGVIKDFSDSYVIVNQDGKTVGYVIAKDADIEQIGNPIEFTEVAMKGLKITYKVLLINNEPAYITYMDIPVPGLEGEGYLSLGINSLYINKARLLIGGYVPFNICLNNIRTNITDSSLAANSTTENLDKDSGAISPVVVKVDVSGEEEDSSYVQKTETRLNIGDVNIVNGSVKVVLNNKELKVIYNNSEFDAKDKADEVKLMKDKTFYYLLFEAPLPEENLEDVLEITYKKMLYTVSTSELTTYNVDDDVYVELNGEEVTLAKALNRGTYAFVTTNSMSEIIYINAFYRNLEAEITEINGNEITINGYKFGKPAFEDKLIISDDVEVIDSKGESFTFDNIKVGDIVKLTVDPELEYQVILIEKK